MLLGQSLHSGQIYISQYYAGRQNKTECRSHAQVMIMVIKNKLLQFMETKVEHNLINGVFSYMLNIILPSIRILILLKKMLKNNQSK